MTAYSTPGVYIEEKSVLPPSVAEVATAIPAFVGYTQKGKAGGVEVAQVSTMLEYEQRFGPAAPVAFTVKADDSLEYTPPVHTLWYAMALYFRNGGGRCYVVSVGNDSQTLDPTAFRKGLDALELEDEPTLIIMPELVGLPATDFASLSQEALNKCHKLGDRFAILDVQDDGSADGGVAAFRNGVTDYLMYGAAYYPYLNSALVYHHDDASVTVESADSGGADNPTLEELKTTQTQRYSKIKRALAAERITLPPSSSIAGIYARVDRDRGVWKAPANVGVMSVVGPQTPVSHATQEGLNIDPTAGKSINVIRAFPGKGTLVWGARTLAGNDNEWRYIPVRRLFIMIEESAKKASSFAVFEPNDATTWLKVRGMIESYLYNLWERGALQGATPEQAYYVQVGLGQTMTPQDVLEGKMIVQIGVAAVRPAEFIVLRFSHKLAEG